MSDILFCDRNIADAMLKMTSARIAVGKSGPRPLTRELMTFRIDHAAARDAIFDEVNDEYVSQWNGEQIQTLIENKEQYLIRPDLGRKVRDQDIERLKNHDFINQQVLILIGGGLSAAAVNVNLPDVLPSIHTGLKKHGYSYSRPIFIQDARVGVMDHVGEVLNPETVILLIGERPGLRTAESMSAYMCYRPNQNTIESDRDVVSNIHAQGLSPVESGAVISDWIEKYIQNQASGMKLKEIKH